MKWLSEPDKTHGHISSEILKLTSIYLLSGMLDEKLCSLINRFFLRECNHEDVFICSNLLLVLNDSAGT